MGHVGDGTIGDALLGGAVGSIVLAIAAALLAARPSGVSRRVTLACAGGCVLGVAVFFLYLQPRFFS